MKIAEKLMVGVESIEPDLAPDSQSSASLRSKRVKAVGFYVTLKPGFETDEGRSQFYANSESELVETLEMVSEV